MININISTLSALNLLTLTENRLAEIERLALEHPDLPMRDPATIRSYEEAAAALRAAIAPVIGEQSVDGLLGLTA